MLVLVVVLCALLGLAIGSFLNVLVHRLPRAESVASPPSACPSCGAAIRNRDNVPVLGWLMLRGRCRDCHEPISPRYPVVEALTGGLFALTAAVIGLDWALPAFLYLVAVGIALAVIDLDHHRLPDVLTLPSYPVGVGLLGAAALLDDRWDDLLGAGIGAAIAFAFYFVVWFAYPAGMGYGDVKLSGVLGLYLGWVSLGALACGLFLGFLLGALGSIALVAFRGAGRKTKVPFGPFMLIGAYLGVLVGPWLAHEYTSLLIG